MRNIIIILLILIIPAGTYMLLSRNSETDSAIAKDKTRASILVFTSSMCLDCRRMKELISEAEETYYDKINFVSINALDKNKKVKDYIKKYNVVLVPTLIFIDSSGNETNKVEGYIPKEELISKIEEAVNG